MSTPVMSLFDLTGRYALVTGGSRGLGLQIAEALGEAGAKVLLTSRKAADLEEAAAQLQARGIDTRWIAADASDPAQVQKVVAEALQRVGRIDILVNNAGVERRADFQDVTEADYDLVLDVNLKGAFFVTQAFARHLRDTRRPGRIINISSVHEELPFPHFASYCASKGGMKMMMRTLAVELAPLGITVNNVAPGAVETPINAKLLNSPELLTALLANIPLQRLGKPADVAGAVAYLASDDASYVTGTTLVVDGGLLWNYSEQ